MQYRSHATEDSFFLENRNFVRKAINFSIQRQFKNYLKLNDIYSKYAYIKKTALTEENYWVSSNPFTSISVGLPVRAMTEAKGKLLR